MDDHIGIALMVLCVINTLVNGYLLIVHFREKQAVEHQKGLVGSVHCPNCFKAYDVNLKSCPHCGQIR